MATEKMAISRKQIGSEVPMVTNEITDDCIYAGLFGSLDSLRMGLVSDKIKKIANDKEIDIVIIDLSNVEAIDTAVAGHINRLVNTLKLVGVDAILCGIKDELADTMVKAGVELDSATIVRNLKSALKVSFTMSGYTLSKIDS